MFYTLLKVKNFLIQSSGDRRDCATYALIKADNQIDFGL